MTHHPKIMKDFSKAVAAGRKMYEVRKNDRPHPYAVGVLQYVSGRVAGTAQSDLERRGTHERI